MQHDACSSNKEEREDVATRDQIVVFDKGSIPLKLDESLDKATAEVIHLLSFGKDVQEFENSRKLFFWSFCITSQFFCIVLYWVEAVSRTIFRLFM